jgi:hypothetical protein
MFLIVKACSVQASIQQADIPAPILTAICIYKNIAAKAAATTPMPTLMELAAPGVAEGEVEASDWLGLGWREAEGVVRFALFDGSPELALARVVMVVVVEALALALVLALALALALPEVVLADLENVLRAESPDEAALMVGMLTDSLTVPLLTWRRSLSEPVGYVHQTAFSWIGFVAM